MVHRCVWGAATAAGALPALPLERKLVRQPLCAASRAARAVHAQHHPRSRLRLVQLLRLRTTRTAGRCRRIPSRARCRTRPRATRASRPLWIAHPRRLHRLRPAASRRGRAGARVPLLCTAAPHASAPACKCSQRRLTLPHRCAMQAASGCGSCTASRRVHVPNSAPCGTIGNFPCDVVSRCASPSSSNGRHASAPACKCSPRRLALPTGALHRPVPTAVNLRDAAWAGARRPSGAPVRV